MFIVAWFSGVGGSFAQESDDTHEFAIEAEKLGEALTALSRQSKTPLLYPFDLAEMTGVNPVNGRYTLHAALQIMLDGTDVSGGLTDSGVIAVSQRIAEPKISREGSVASGQLKNGLLTSVSAFLFSAGAASGRSAKNTRARGPPCIHRLPRR